MTAVLAADGRLLRYEVDATAGDEAERDGILAFIDLDLDLVISDHTAVVTDLIEPRMLPADTARMIAADRKKTVTSDGEPAFVP